MIDAATALAKLSARGITKLESFAESKASMRKAVRIDSKAAEKIFERLAAPRDPSVKSKVAPPSSSIPLVLDGKRVDSNEIARLNGHPLDYVATTLKSGETALVVFTDRAIIRKHIRESFQEPLRATSSVVADALITAGLQPQSGLSPFGGSGVQIYEDIDFGGDTTFIPVGAGVEDLTQFDEGREFFDESWNDLISSVWVSGCNCFATENINWDGASITLGTQSNLHDLGWGDRISSIWARNF